MKGREEWDEGKAARWRRSEERLMTRQKRLSASERGEGDGPREASGEDGQKSQAFLFVSEKTVSFLLPALS